MRRGHRLHSFSNDLQLSNSRLYRDESCVGYALESAEESSLLDLIRSGECETLELLSKEPAKTISVTRRWPFVRKCIRETVATTRTDVIRAVLAVLTDTNPRAFEVGELFVNEALDVGQAHLATSVLDFWMNSNRDSNTPLDLVRTSELSTVRPRDTQTLRLLETAIYGATVDRKSNLLHELLQWQEVHSDLIGTACRLNADCLIHASLEEDRERLALLFSFGYRLGTDTDQRINKDYLKRIKLFRARASPVYKSVVFEESRDIYNDDPLKKAFEYARQARINAAVIQDFTKEYTEIARRCEEFARSLLDKCTTKHEVQTLLQTRSYKGHTDANFNIAILDGHKEFVAHEKFQQLLHKKWGQRDRVHWSNSTSYNIFWSEKSSTSKIIHILKQVAVFLLLPFVYILTTPNCLANCHWINWLNVQTQIPVNRFLYWEVSKTLFHLLIFVTLMERGDEFDGVHLLTAAWILSFVLENVRTVLRLHKFGGKSDLTRLFERWLTFRNVYILATDIIFLLSLLLRLTSSLIGQCRSECEYNGNEVAFVAAAVWAVAALLSFLRSIQGGLMWRQTGPVIISMSYMILDVLVFLFIFVIVFFAFTLSTVYIYAVYNSSKTLYFNDHKTALKLFFWAMIRTGNPQYADIYADNKSDANTNYDLQCIRGLINDSATNSLSSSLSSASMASCTMDSLSTSSSSSSSMEEGVSYLVGSTLWAFYQFTVVIVLLSILRARMVNTYHRIFKEADVQWKFFRASIWWKYLDEESVLPPPYTLIFFLGTLINLVLPLATRHRLISVFCTMDKEAEAKSERRQREIEEAVHNDKTEFEKRYKRLMLMLVSNKSNTNSDDLSFRGQQHF